jgi:hypothetical protein
VMHAVVALPPIREVGGFKREFGVCVVTSVSSQFSRPPQAAE